MPADTIKFPRQRANPSSGASPFDRKIADAVRELHISEIAKELRLAPPEFVAELRRQLSDALLKVRLRECLFPGA